MAKFLLAELTFQAVNPLLIRLNLLSELGKLRLFLHFDICEFKLLVVDDFLEVLNRIELRVPL